MKNLVYILTTLFVVSCIKDTADMLDSEVSECMIPVTVELSQSRTVIDGNQISFAGAESMSLVCSDVNAANVYNRGLDFYKFSGEFNPVGYSKNDAEWYAVYPYVGLGQNRYGDCCVPVAQTAPFDASANFMCSDLVKADYDESSMPKLSVSMNQLLGIIKVSFTNSSEDYKDDLVQEVVLTSSTPLAGEFSLMFDDYGKPVPEFRGDVCRVLSSYHTPVVLGVNKIHVVYISVNPAEIKDASITVRTDRHVFTRKAKSSFVARQGDLTYMEPMDVASTFEVSESRVKTLIAWGDDYTNRGRSGAYVSECNYTYHLQKMLGSEWEVINGGYPGEDTYTIAARQGGIDSYIGAYDFTVPESTDPVQVYGFYVINHNRKYKTIWPRTLLNPCEIVVEDESGNEVARVEGNLNCVLDGASTVYFTRSEPGEEIHVPAKSKVMTYAAKHLRKPDLTVIYMGNNGGFNTLNTLYNQHRAMIEYAAAGGPEDYIVLGFHSCEVMSRLELDQTYWDLFDGPDGFGVNPEAGRPASRFVNLNKELTGENYKELLFRSGASATPSGVSPKDVDYVNRGMMPFSYWYALENVSPGPYGAKAFALLVYDKMVELGYI